MKKTRKSKSRVDISGKRFGLLIAREYVKGEKWICDCDCGNETIVDTRNLNSNHTKSCGCLVRAKAAKNVYDMNNFENSDIIVLEELVQIVSKLHYGNASVNIVELFLLQEVVQFDQKKLLHAVVKILKMKKRLQKY